MIHRGSRKPRNLHRGGRRIDLLCKGERTIYLSPRAFRAVTKVWLDEHVRTTVIMTEDADGKWFEVAVDLPDSFVGDAEIGWTGPMVAGKPDITLALYHSSDLQSWTSSGWIAAPGRAPEDLGGGRKRWFGRWLPTPALWFNIMSDLRITSNRFGKSITSIVVGGSSVSLTGFPYAIPGAAASLQADLRTAGFAGALVTSASAPISLSIRNHFYEDNSYRTVVLTPTMSGSNVTAVHDRGAPISLPGFPYAMPAAAAALQADLRTAGKTGAVVRLLGDEWTVFLPDTNNKRSAMLTFTPDDPFKAWNVFGVYLGELPDNWVSSTEENLRNPLGEPLTESPRGFARVGLAH